MKNKNFILAAVMFVLIIILSLLTLFNTNTNKPTLSATNNGTSTNTKRKYTRKELQDYVVATAASYYYNNVYTDYEGYWSEESRSNYSSVYDISPEELSRSRYTTMQCVNFAANSYIYSLGFDFSKYRASLSNNRYTKYYSFVNGNNNVINTQYIYASSNYNNSDNAYKNTYKYFSKVFSCQYLNRIAYDIAARASTFNYNNDLSKILVLTYQSDNYSKDKNCTSKSNCPTSGIIKNYNGNFGTNASVTDKMKGKYANKFYKNIIDNLQPGDLYINDGHTMVWVGDLFSKYSYYTVQGNDGKDKKIYDEEEGYKGGIIHSSGLSFVLGNASSSNSVSNSSTTESYMDENGVVPNVLISVSNNTSTKKFQSGTDSYSVRYSDEAFFKMNQVAHHGKKTNQVATILRPINVICKEWSSDGNTCNKLADGIKIDDNVMARVKLKYLGVEQYAYSDANKKKMSADTASVNVGDYISYKLNLTNNSKFSYCSSGKVDNEEDCVNPIAYCSKEEEKNNNYDKCIKNGGKWTNPKGFCSGEPDISNETDCANENLDWILNNYKWKTFDNSKKYENIVITAKVPDGTTFVSCQNGGTKAKCSYDKKTNTVKWTNVNISAEKSYTYTYTVMVNVDYKNDSIVNEGMNVIYNDTTLSLGSIKTFVNSTINGVLKDKLLKIINNDINEKCENSIVYAKQVYNELAKDSNISENKLDMGTYLNPSNIVNNIFIKTKNSDGSEYYTIREPNKNNDFSKMMVPYFYGGKLYEKVFHKGEMEKNYYTIRPLSSSGIIFNVGDLIVTLKRKTDGTFKINNVFIYTDSDSKRATYTYCKSGAVVKHSYRSGDTYKYSTTLMLHELYDSDLYVVLRPSINYNFKLNDKFVFASTHIESKDQCPSGYDYIEETKNGKKTGKCYKNIDYYNGYTYEDYGLKDIDSVKREGYSVNGANIYVSGNATSIKNDTLYKYGYSIYPVWKANVYKITLVNGDTSSKKIYFKYNNGWYSNENVTKKIEKVTSTKDGYKFLGYYTEKNGKGIKVIDEKGNIVANNTQFTKDTTIYANYKVNTLTINYYANDALNSDGSKPSKPLATKIYNYDGTNFRNYGLPNFVGSSAMWNLHRDGYTTSSNWAVGSSNGKAISYNRKFEYVYDFVDAIGRKTEFIKNDIEVNLYALWIKNDIYSISLDSQGGSNGTSVLYTNKTNNWYSDVNCSTIISNVIVPKRDGYIFNGYYTNPNGNGTEVIKSNGQIIGSANVYKSNTILYASWKANTLTINYYANGGVNADNTTPSEPLATIVYNYDGIDFKNYGLPNFVGSSATWNLHKDGFVTGRGWLLGKPNGIKIDYNKQYDFIQDFVNDINMLNKFNKENIEIDLYAAWVDAHYEITLDYQLDTLKFKNNNIDSLLNKLFVDNKNNWYVDSFLSKPVKKIIRPINIGVHFDGFYTSPNGNGNKVIDKDGNILNNSFVVKSNMTLYAYWKINTFTIYYYANGGINEDESIPNNPIETRVYNYDGTNFKKYGLPNFVGSSATWNLHKDGFTTNKSWSINDLKNDLVNYNQSFATIQDFASFVGLRDEFDYDDVEIKLYASWLAVEE